MEAIQNKEKLQRKCKKTQQLSLHTLGSCIVHNFILPTSNTSSSSPVPYTTCTEQHQQHKQCKFCKETNDNNTHKYTSSICCSQRTWTYHTSHMMYHYPHGKIPDSICKCMHAHWTSNRKKNRLKKHKENNIQDDSIHNTDTQQPYVTFNNIYKYNRIAKTYTN